MGDRFEAMDVDSGTATYHPDRYYINMQVDRQPGCRREAIVPAWRFWWTYLRNPWRWRRWRRVLREKDGFTD